MCVDELVGVPFLKQACSWSPMSAICVQNLDDSLSPAIHTRYRISLRSSSLREPRYPLLRVVFWFSFLATALSRSAAFRGWLFGYKRVKKGGLNIVRQPLHIYIYIEPKSTAYKHTHRGPPSPLRYVLPRMRRVLLVDGSHGLVWMFGCQ